LWFGYGWFTNRSCRADPRVPVPVGVVDVDLVVARVVRVERDREQALLAAAHDARAHVEERRSAHPPVHEHADQALLLDDVEPVRLAPGRRDVEGAGEPGGDEPQAELRALGVRGGARGRGGDRRDEEGEEPHVS
jgi:hypothetical protein